MLFLVVPAVELAVLKTTNVVFQRYALFAMPFYLLLLSNALAPGSLRANGRERLLSVGAIAAAVGVLVLFVMGAATYVSPDQHTRIVRRPDYKKISAYLAASARPEDTIVFAGWDPVVSQLYWQGHDPAPSFNILDPKLYTHDSQGSIYWVVGYDFDLPPGTASDPLWSGVEPFTGGVVYRQQGPSADPELGAGRILTWIEKIQPRPRAIEHLVYTLRGTQQQVQGEAAQAAKDYLSAGTFYPMGDEYLQTAKGFASRGDFKRAWRDMLISKSMQPHNPALHEAMSEILSGQGLRRESQIESDLAGNLQQALAKLR
jgi:hypothetical protein